MRPFLKLHQRLRFDGAQAQLLIFVFQLFDAPLLLVASRRKRRVFFAHRSPA